MRARWYLLVLGLLLALGGVVLIALRDPSPSIPANATNLVVEKRDAPSLATPAGAAPSSTARTLPVERTDALAIQWNDASRDVVGPVIEGTLVVVDRDGTKHDGEEGAFVPDFVDGDDSELEEGERRHIAVHHGLFRFDARRATVMVVHDLELGGRPAAVDRGVEFTAGAPLTITARWIDDALLHVVDATTHAELADVTVARDASQGATAHPGRLHPEYVALAHARSPFHVRRENPIEKMQLRDSIWIGASGHVWQSVTIDFGRELERTIELAPAGALAIAVTEPDDPAANEVSGLPPLHERAPRLRLRNGAATEAGMVIVDVPAHATDFAFDGLAPGDLVASIEVGEPFPTPIIVSRAAVTIDAGATAHATLCLDLSKAPPATTLAGTLYVPPAWGETKMQVECAPLFTAAGIRAHRGVATSAVLEPVRNRPRWYAWSVTPIFPATYRLHVERAGFDARVDVGADGRDDVVLTLPEPALLRVRVVDAATQAAVEVERLSWNSEIEPDWLESRSLRTLHFQDRVTTLKWDPSSGCCVGAVRPGRGRITGLCVDPAAPNDADGGEEFTVETGANDLVVHGHSPCGLDLEIVRSGERPALLRVNWQKIDAADSEAMGQHGLKIIDGREMDGRDKDARIVLPGPGRYRISPVISGNTRAIVPFEIDVANGEFVKRTVTLRKE